MRPTVLYGSILITCLIITTVKADRKWKYNYDNPYSYDKNEEKQEKKTKYSKNQAVKNFEASEEEVQDRGNSYQKKNKKDNLEETSNQKRFIGRIEHGKVKVLRRKDDKNQSDASDDDYREKVCRKSTSGKTLDCDEYNDEGSSEENGKPKKSQKKMKYSIKFQHEKQKKKENNEDISVTRLHKNGRKRYGKYDDDDGSDEDESPIKRRRFAEDDD